MQVVYGPSVVEAQARHDLTGTAPSKYEQHREDAEEAWERLEYGQTWADWITIGEFMLDGRSLAMHRANTNVPAGRAYNTQFSAWLRETKYDKRIDASARAKLFECMEHRHEIETWRATLTGNVKLEKFNHPATVLRHWRTSTKKKDDAPARPSPMAKLKAANIDLQETLARMEREIKRGGGDLWTAEDTAKDIAKVIVAKISASKAREVARELTRLTARDAQKKTPAACGDLVWKGDAS